MVRPDCHVERPTGVETSFQSVFEIYNQTKNNHIIMDMTTKTAGYQRIGGGNYQTPELNVIDLQIEGAICFDSTVSGNGSFGDLNQGDDL